MAEDEQVVVLMSPPTRPHRRRGRRWRAGVGHNGGEHKKAFCPLAQHGDTKRFPSTFTTNPLLSKRRSTEEKAGPPAKKATVDRTQALNLAVLGCDSWTEAAPIVRLLGNMLDSKACKKAFALASKSGDPEAVREIVDLKGVQSSPDLRSMFKAAVNDRDAEFTTFMAQRVLKIHGIPRSVYKADDREFFEAVAKAGNWGGGFGLSVHCAQAQGMEYSRASPQERAVLLHRLGPWLERAARNY